MTRLSKRKTQLRFVTGAEIRYRGKLRPVIIEAGDMVSTVRLAGTRQRYPFSWHGVFQYAAELFARMERERRRQERKARRLSR